MKMRAFRGKSASATIASVALASTGAAVFSALTLLCICAPQVAATVSNLTQPPHRSVRLEALATIPFTLDADRILMNVSFRTPDGNERRALAWFNMGMPAPILTKALYRELGVDHGAPLVWRAGALVVEASGKSVVDGDGGVGNPDFKQRFGPYPVEAMLPASMLRTYVVTLDYQRQILSIAQSGEKRPEGVAVPFAMNDASGLIAIDVSFDGQNVPMVIDAGGGYSWMRGDVVKRWFVTHPEWRRAEGAVGVSNYNMLDYSFEKEGTVARVPNVSVGGVLIGNLGVLGTGPVLGTFWDGLFGDLFWDNWQKAAPGPVGGWLGANALRPFRVTIDYPGHTIYWQRLSAADSHELDQIGLNLVRHNGAYFVGAIVHRARIGAPDETSVAGVEPGDELVAVDGVGVRGASIGSVLSDLHGAPGEPRTLTIIDRRGASKEVVAHVLAFD
jgi:hypothetical protein